MFNIFRKPFLKNNEGFIENHFTFLDPFFLESSHRFLSSQTREEYFNLRTNILAKRLIFQKEKIVKHIDETISI